LGLRLCQIQICEPTTQYHLLFLDDQPTTTTGLPINLPFLPISLLSCQLLHDTHKNGNNFFWFSLVPFYFTIKDIQDKIYFAPKTKKKKKKKTTKKKQKYKKNKNKNKKKTSSSYTLVFVHSIRSRYISTNANH